MFSFAIILLSGYNTAHPLLAAAPAHARAAGLTSPEQEVWTFVLLDSGQLFDAADSGCRDGAVGRMEGVGPITLGQVQDACFFTKLYFIDQGAGTTQFHIVRVNADG